MWAACKTIYPGTKKLKMKFEPYNFGNSKYKKLLKLIRGFKNLLFQILRKVNLKIDVEILLLRI